VAGVPTYESTFVTLGGKVTDLYDFDLDAPSPAIYGAVVQAGYNSLARTAGHVFRVEIDLTGTLAVEHNFQY
jgi:hypothetical protein